MSRSAAKADPFTSLNLLLHVEKGNINNPFPGPYTLLRKNVAAYLKALQKVKYKNGLVFAESEGPGCPGPHDEEVGS